MTRSNRVSARRNRHTSTAWGFCLLVPGLSACSLGSQEEAAGTDALETPLRLESIATQKPTGEAQDTHSAGPQTTLGSLRIVQSGKPLRDLRESGGSGKGYAFIMQILPEGRAPEVRVYLRPDPTWAHPSDWVWTSPHPGDNQLEHELSFKWYGQASCPDDLTSLTLTGPEGTLVQNPLSNPIWGYFHAQSFTLDTVRNICIDWATDNNCDPIDPGCQHEESFDLVGGVGLTSPADRLLLKASCVGGPVANTYYAPVMRLTCDRSGVW